VGASLRLGVGPEQTAGHRIDISTTNDVAEVLLRLASELSNEHLVVYAGRQSLSAPQGFQVGVSRDELVTGRAMPARTRSPRR